MVAFFRYSPIDILSVRLPPLTLEFSGYTEQEWLRKEAAEVPEFINTFRGYLEMILSFCNIFGFVFAYNSSV